MGFMTKGFTPAFYAYDYSGGITTTYRTMVSSVEAGWYELDFRFLVESNTSGNNYFVVNGASPTRYIKVPVDMVGSYYHEKIIVKVASDNAEIRVKTSNSGLNAQFIYLSMKKIAEIE